MACYQRGIFIYSIEVNILISWTEASIGYWFHIMQRFTSLNVHVGQLPTFHDPVILFCILKNEEYLMDECCTGDIDSV